MMDNLFETDTTKYMPLAARMRPRNLYEYMGQKEILGEGTLLRKAIEEDKTGSLILFGPPGSGKTTLAEVIASTTKAIFVPM
ncbi:MAG: AAA family ATPase, partial [Firmicutes bacterium]|nr:AAA family ATPase [Bacillota bacterium]